MKIDLRKISAAGLSVVIAFTAFGCGDANKKEEQEDHTEAILSTAGDFCSYIKALDIDKAAKISEENLASELNELEPLLVFEEGDIYSADAAVLAEAVAGTIDYSINESSVMPSKKKPKGTVDVKFSVADPTGLINDDQYTDIESLVADIDNAAVIEFTVVLEICMNDDGDWIVNDYGTLTDQLFSFTSIRDLTLELALGNYVEGIIWNGCDETLGDGYFTNTIMVGIGIYFTEGTELDVENMTYTLVYEGEEVLTHPVIDYDDAVANGSSSLIVFVTMLDTGVPYAPNGHYFAEGNYSIVLSLNGEEYYSVDFVCYYDPEPSYYNLAEAAGEFDVDDEISDEFYEDIDQERSGWYSGDERMDGPCSSGIGSLSYRLYVTEDHGEMGFTMFYGASAMVEEPVMDHIDMIEVDSYPVTIADDGSMYYECIIEGDVADGYYIVVIDEGPYDSPVAEGVILSETSVGIDNLQF